MWAVIGGVFTSQPNQLGKSSGRQQSAPVTVQHGSAHNNLTEQLLSLCSGRNHSPAERGARAYHQPKRFEARRGGGGGGESEFYFVVEKS